MKFKIGDRVHCLLYGKGVVIYTTSLLLPITIKFDDGKVIAYTSDGRPSLTSNITLTPGTWEIKEVIPEPEFEKGQAVWVRDDENEEWKLRYYSHSKNEKHFVFYEQKKKGGIIDYNFIKPFEGVDPNNE